MKDMNEEFISHTTTDNMSVEYLCSKNMKKLPVLGLGFAVDYSQQFSHFGTYNLNI